MQWSNLCQLKRITNIFGLFLLTLANTALATIFVNAGFEQPPVGATGYVYSPTQSAVEPGEFLGWTFNSGSGVTGKRSPFTNGNRLLGSGQVAFIQNTGGISQQLYLAAGTYTLFFRATQRSNYQQGTQVIGVYVGSNHVGNFTPGSGDLQSFTSSPFTVSDGNQVISLRGAGSGTDYTAFIDGVSISSNSTFDQIFTNNVRIVTPGTAPLIAPALANAVNNPGPIPDPCANGTPFRGGPGNYSAYHTMFSWSDAICQGGITSNVKVSNINPVKDYNRYFWAEGYTKLTFTSSLSATYRGVAYSQPVLEFYHTKYKNSNGSRLTFYVNPQFYGNSALPTNPDGSPIYIFNDGGCTNGCTGKPLVTGWFGTPNNPYMSFGTAASCPMANNTSLTSCNLTNASLVITLSQFRAILAALVASTALQPGEDDPTDWSLRDYQFDVEMTANGSTTPYIDETISAVQFAASSDSVPGVTFYINGIANGNVTMPSLGSFTLKYVSQNATSCDLSTIQNGQPWYTYPNYGLSYDWGTVSGWGGPATFTWTALCRNDQGQTASNSASLTIQGPAPPPSVTFYINAIANGNVTMPSLGSFTLKYVSQNATSCDLSAIQNGQPWYSYPNYGLSYDWGTVSGWGGPATFTWTALCRNGQGQTASNSASLTIQGSAPLPTIANSGFESPAVGTGSYAYGPAGGSWTFDPAGPTGGAGVSGNGSAFTASNPNAPFGSQIGFIQGAHAFVQTLNFSGSGSYHITFYAGQRATNQQNLQVKILVDGVSYGTITPSSTTYLSYSSNSFSVAAGAHTLMFSGVNSTGGDNTIFFDKVQIVSP